MACPLTGSSSLTPVAGSTATSASTASPANETRIAIDGKPGDWAGRSVLFADVAGDAEEGFLDLTAGYAFVNEHALYMLIGAVDAKAPVTSLEMDIHAGSRRLRIGWDPQTGYAWRADITGEWQQLSSPRYSSFALSDALEVRLDMRDLSDDAPLIETLDSPPLAGVSEGSLDSVRLVKIEVMVGQCCGSSWRSSDRWAPSISTPVERAPGSVPSIDGSAGDWLGRSVLFEDPAGDPLVDSPDLTTGYAFVSGDALYLLVDAVDRDVPFVHFEIEFEAGSRRLAINWRPGSSRGFLEDVTSNWSGIGDTSFAAFSFDTALEARIDFRDIGVGSPEQVRLTGVGVRAGTCCDETWLISDRWSPYLATPLVVEVDPAWRLAPAGGAQELERLLATPDTRAITVDYDAATRRARVTGASGAVPELAYLLVGNVELNDFVTLRADGQGGFETEVAGVPGTHVLVKQDATGRIIQPGEVSIGEDTISPGVMLRIPVPTSTDGVAFSAGARRCCEGAKNAPWSIEGTFERDALAPRGRFQISGRVTLWADDSSTPPAAHLDFRGNLMADADGRQVGRAGKFISPFLTATGLPIERTLARINDEWRGTDSGPPLGFLRLGTVQLRWTYDGARWAGDFSETLRVPQEARTGLYTLSATGLWELNDVSLPPSGLRAMEFTVRDDAANQTNLGVFTIGDPAPMRLATTLLADEVSEGSRGGIIAREDQGLFDVSPRAATRHEPVLPRMDAYGDSRVYRLEPFVPMVDVVDRIVPSSPALAFDFSDSTLTCTIERPDGVTEVLGPAPLTRYGVKSPRTPWRDNVAMGLGGGELREVPQLLGDGDTFAYRFPLDGDYVITIDGHIADRSGHRHEIGGVYDLTVANILDIETALLPGTPFEVGDPLPVALTVFPGVPADITYTITHVAGDGSVTQETFTGQAGGNGWWDGGGATWTFERDGEYRVDLQACYAGADGRLWAGRLRFGSAVATPDGPIVAHGRRGSDGILEIPPPWGLEREFNLEEGAVASHMHFPYFNGDIVWGIERVLFDDPDPP